MRRLEVRQLERDPIINNTMPKHINRATHINLRSNTLREPTLRSIRNVAVPARQQLLPRLRLRRTNKREQLRRVQTKHPVEVRRHRLHITARKKRRLNRVLKRLLILAHAATPGISNSPVTAAVIKA